MYDEEFRMDNTEGYTQEELDALNIEQAERLENIDPDSQEYHEIIKQFSDEVAGRDSSARFCDLNDNTHPQKPTRDKANYE